MASDTLLADNVVVATGGYHNPRVPPFARELDESIVQLHSKEYRNPSQIQEGGVLVVGAGNSGAEIAIELAPPPPDMAIGPGHRAGAHAGRESSRSPVHAHHVVHGDAGSDGEDADLEERSATTFSIPLVESLWAGCDGRTSPPQASKECRE